MLTTYYAMATAETNSGTVWVDKEVKAPLAIWGDSKIQEELDGAVRNKAICKEAPGTRI